MTLRTKLIILVILVALLPAAAVGMLAYHLSRSALDQHIRSAFQDRAELIEHQINSILLELDHNALAWALAPAMADISIGDADMRMFTFLANSKKSYKFIKDITAFDRKGVISTSTNPSMLFLADGSDQGNKISHLAAFPIAKVLQNTRFMTINPPGQSSFIALPVPDPIMKDGSLLGGLVIELDIEAIARTIDEVNKGKDSDNHINVYLSLATGEIRSLVDQAFSLDYRSLQNIVGSAPGFDFARFAAQPQDFVAQSFKLPQVIDSMSMPLFLTIAQPEAMVFASVYRLRMIVGLLTMALTLIFTAVLHWFGSGVIDGLVQLL